MLQTPKVNLRSTPTTRPLALRIDLDSPHVYMYKKERILGAGGLCKEQGIPLTFFWLFFGFSGKTVRIFPKKAKFGAQKSKNGLFLMIFDKKMHFLQK